MHHWIGISTQGTVPMIKSNTDIWTIYNKPFGGGGFQSVHNNKLLINIPQSPSISPGN